MNTKDIEDKLEAEGYDSMSVVFWPRDMRFYVPGLKSEDLPSFDNLTSVDDPSLVDE